MLALVFIASVLSLASQSWASPTISPSGLNQTGLPACPAGSSQSPIVDCVGAGYSGNDTKITWPNATSGWAASARAAVTWETSTAYTTGWVWLYNRNVSVLPQRIAPFGTWWQWKDGGASTQFVINADQTPPAPGYWLVMRGVATDSNGTPNGNGSWVLASSQEFEIKPKGSKVDYPPAYASLAKTSGAERMAVGAPLAAVLVAAAMSVL